MFSVDAWPDTAQARKFYFTEIGKVHGRHAPAHTAFWQRGLERSLSGSLPAARARRGGVAAAERQAQGQVEQEIKWFIPGNLVGSLIGKQGCTITKGWGRCSDACVPWGSSGEMLRGSREARGPLRSPGSRPNRLPAAAALLGFPDPGHSCSTALFLVFYT